MHLCLQMVLIVARETHIKFSHTIMAIENAQRQTRGLYDDVRLMTSLEAPLLFRVDIKVELEVKVESRVF